MVAPLAAIGAALATISCCLPFGTVAALGLAGASAFLARYRTILLVAAAVLLGVGFWQQRRATQCAARRSVTSVVLLWLAVAVVAGLVLFPQDVAAVLARW